MPNPALEGLLNIFRREGPPNLSERAAADYPEMEAAWAASQIEMPKQAQWVRSIRPMNVLERFLKPQAQAITHPWGTIAYSPRKLREEQADLGDMLAHELTHAGQYQREGTLGMLKNILTGKSSAYEDEAWGAEQKRPVRRGDIQLPPD